MSESSEKKWAAIWWAMYFLLMSLPIVSKVLFFQNVPLDQPVNPTSLNGFIAASGIFLGFLTSIAASKGNMLGRSLNLAIVLDLYLFAGALAQIYISLFSGGPNIADLMTIMTSLMADVGTAVTIVQRLRRQN